MSLLLSQHASRVFLSKQTYKKICLFLSKPELRGNDKKKCQSTYGKPIKRLRKTEIYLTSSRPRSFPSEDIGLSLVSRVDRLSVPYPRCVFDARECTLAKGARSSSSGSGIASSLTPFKSAASPAIMARSRSSSVSSSSSPPKRASSSSSESSALLGPAPSTIIHAGITWPIAMMLSSQNAGITYPLFTPQEKVAPADMGPMARPMPEKVVANPFRVPRMRRDGAEFVRRMVIQGKPTMTAKPLTRSRPNSVANCRL